MALGQRAGRDDFEAVSLQDVLRKKFDTPFKEVFCESQIFFRILSGPYDGPARVDDLIKVIFVGYGLDFLRFHPSHRPSPFSVLFMQTFKNIPCYPHRFHLHPRGVWGAVQLYQGYLAVFARQASGACAH